VPSAETRRCVDGPDAASYPAAMRLDKLCSLEFSYLDAHFPKPYGDQSGPGWGIGEGTVSGARLSGTQNPPSRTEIYLCTNDLQ